MNPETIIHKIIGGSKIHKDKKKKDMYAKCQICGKELDIEPDEVPVCKSCMFK
jgi:ribosomal protein L34E